MNNESSHCLDCGTKLECGICPNCEEELYIFETSEEHDYFSEKFMDKVKEQRSKKK